MTTDNGGIIYIKVARKDAQGNDNTLSLQELTNLRFKFSDHTNTANYLVQNITEYPSYYLYQIIVNQVSSSNNNVLNYYVSASYTGSSISCPSGNTGISGSSGYTNISGNSLGYFQQSYGDCIFSDTPNIKIIISASANLNGISAGNRQLFLHDINSGLNIASSSIAVTAATCALSASVNPIEGANYYLYCSFSGTGGSYSNVQFLFTQSISPSTYSNLTVLEPYLTTNFNNSDCNILINNVEENHHSKKYREVLYNSGMQIPSNYQQILSQSAEFAPINDYNYASKAQTLPRYEGVRTIQQKENVWTSGDVGYSKTPSVQNLETYFGYFGTMGGTSYELIGMEAVGIMYLIDKDGNVLSPSTDAPYYANLLQNFESGKKARILLEKGSNATPGLYPIVKTGVYPRPTIWSQSGSSANSSSAISFQTSASVPNFTTVINLGTGSIVNNYLNILSTSGSINAINGTYVTSSLVSSSLTNNLSYITSSLTSNQVVIKPRINVTVDGTSPNALLFRITSGSTPHDIIYEDRKYFTATTHPPLNVVWDVNIPPTYHNPTNNYRYEFYLENYNLSTSTILSGGSISLLQDPPVTNIPYPYFYTSSITQGVLCLASSSMLGALNQMQTSPSYAGYISNIPFTFEPYDEIRFSGDENQTYTILSYITDHTDGPHLILDRTITPGTDVNSFFIRRYVQAPTSIILNTGSPTGGGTGFIFPEYTSLDIQNNFDIIIKNLKEKGLIPT